MTPTPASRRRSAVLIGIVLGMLALSGCAGSHPGAQAEHGSDVLPSAVPSHPVPTPPVADSPLPSLSAPPLDPAATRAALAQLANTAVPPGAVESATAPPGDGISDRTHPRCEPEADESAYWEVAGMSLADTDAWVRAHPSAGLSDAGDSEDSGNDEVIEAAGVPVEAPSHSVLILTINPSHSGGSVIKADSIVIQADAACPSHPGVVYAFGG